MPTPRQQILEWAASGHLNPNNIEQALAVTQSMPMPATQLRFLSRVVLVFAVLLLCSGVIFFFAYNWDDLSRFNSSLCLWGERKRGRRSHHRRDRASGLRPPLPVG